jgi:hypothetical protein
VPASNPWRALIAERGNGATRTLGAGFLIDGQRVLTCAHLVMDRAEVQVSFTQAGRRDLTGLPATVAFRGPWSVPGSRGDVAVLEFSRRVDISPARPVLTTPHGGRLLAHGFPSNSGSSGALLRLRLTSADEIGEWQHIEADHGHTEFPRDGFSGAAIYDEHTGAVVGMLTDSAGDPARRTGRMLPISTIRQYWEELDDVIDLEWLRVAERRRALRLIVSQARLDTRDLEDLVLETFPAAQQPRDLRSVWDAVRYVAEELMGHDRLARFLWHIAPRVTQPAIRSALETWLRQTLPAPPDPAGASASIVVRVDGKSKGGYRLTFATSTSDGPGESSMIEISAKEEIRGLVEDQLPQLMRRVAGRDPIIEFALPQALLSEPVDEWFIDRANRIPLRDYRVTVHDVARMAGPDPVLYDKWITRSKGLHTVPRPASGLLDCGRVQPAKIYDWIMAQPDMCVLLTSYRPPPAVLRKILISGVPVALWPRVRCAAPDHESCDRHKLAALLRPVIDSAAFDELPELVRRLRLEARLQQGQPHFGPRLTLLWDDPDRLPDPPTYTDGHYD